jgi:hypothetical protein
MSESDVITSDVPIPTNTRGTSAKRRPTPRAVPKWKPKHGSD